MTLTPSLREEVLALAAEPVALATTHAQQYAEALQTVEDAASQAMMIQVQKDTDSLTTATTQYLSSTLHPVDSDLYASSAWYNAFLADENKAITLLKSSAQMGWNLGKQHLRTDSATLGLGAPPIPDTVPATRWVDAATQRITDAYNEWRGKIQLALHQAIAQGDLSPTARAELFNELADKINANLVLRTSLGASTTVQRSHTDALNLGARALGRVKLVWITNFTENTCGMCAALDGTMVDPNESFDATATTSGNLVPVFTDLAGPPRHPNCNCVIAMVLDGAQPPPQHEFAGEQPGLIDRLVALFNKLRGSK